MNFTNLTVWLLWLLLLIEEVTAHVQSDGFEDAQEICADGTYFPNNLRTFEVQTVPKTTLIVMCSRV